MPEFGRVVRWDVPLLDGYQARFCPSATRNSVSGVVRWDVPLLDGYQARFCPSATRNSVSGADGFRQHPNWDIIQEVASRNTDVVWVHGYAHPNAWLAAAAVKVRGARLLIREEQTLLDSRQWYTRALKQVALRALFSQGSGLYIGEQNRRYFRHYGMPEERLFPARYCVDNQFFREQAAQLLPRRDEIRGEFGITDAAPVVLFCGKFIEKKQPLLLVDAFERLRRQQRCWLLMVGDGLLRSTAEDAVKRRQIPTCACPASSIRRSSPRHAAADIFVLPSAFRETWGLVVNEAMNFSLPIIVSDKVGCADLVRPGWNGFVVPHRNIEDLAEAMARLVGDEERRREFGERSFKLVGEYSIEACADGIVAACLAQRPRETPREVRSRLRAVTRSR